MNAQEMQRYLPRTAFYKCVPRRGTWMISEFSFTIEGAEEGMGYLERGVEVQWTQLIDLCGACTGSRDSPALQNITV